MKKIVIILFSIVLLSCEQEYKAELNQTVLHGLVFEGKTPKIILAQALEAFPEYAFNIEYYDQPFSIGDYSNIEISISCDGQVYKNFTEVQKVLVNNDKFSLQPANIYIKYFIDESFIPEAGKEYTIEVKEIPNEFGDYSVGFYNLKSKTYVPEKIPVSIKQLKNEISEVTGNESKFVYDISFNDPKESKNYYFLTLSKVESDRDFIMDTINMDKLWLELRAYDFSEVYLVPIYVNSDLIDLQPENPNLNQNSTIGVLISDKDFNGQEKRIRIEVDNYTVDNKYTSYVVAELLNVSEEYYKYYLSLKKQSSSQQDVFSEPTQAYSNIENGLGVFAGASMSVQSMKMVLKLE